MPGAFSSPWGPLLQPGMTEEEVKKRQQGMLGGFADFGGATSTIATEMGHPEIAQELQRLQEQDATGSMVGDAINPLSYVTGPLADIGSGLKEWWNTPSSEPPQAMSQDAYIKERSRPIPGYADYEAKAVENIMNSKAYQDTVARGQSKQARGMVSSARTAAGQNYEKDKTLIGEDNAKLPTSYRDVYVPGVNDEMESYYGQDFKDRNPGLAKALAAAGPLLAGGLTAGAFRKVNKTMKKWGMEAKKAASEGRLADEVQALDKLQWWRDKGATGLTRENQTKAIGAGLSATVPFDLQLYGDVIDRKGLSPTYQDASGEWQPALAQKTAEDKLSDPMQYLKENLPTALISGGVGAAVGSKFGGKSMADEASALLNPADPQRYADIAKNRIAAIEAQKAIDAAKTATPPTPRRARSLNQPQPAVAGPAPGGNLSAPVSPAPPPGVTRAQAKAQADGNALQSFNKGLSQLAKGQPVNLGSVANVPPKRLANQETLIKQAVLDNPNLSPAELSKVLRGQAKRGQLKLGLAGAATGYSAILAEKLMRLEEEKLNKP